MLSGLLVRRFPILGHDCQREFQSHASRAHLISEKTGARLRGLSIGFLGLNCFALAACSRILAFDGPLRFSSFIACSLYWEVVRRGYFKIALNYASVSFWNSLYRSKWWFVISSIALFCGPVASAAAQGGPPFYTNDPGTPGNHNWEINLGYMPFFYSGQSVSHTPDVDINFGVGARIQLTYENAWLRVQNPFSKVEYGLGQSNPGVKWRFYDAGEGHLGVSIFPQAFLNNPGDAVRRGITPTSDTFLMPFEFTDKVGPLDVDFEIGYQIVHPGPDGWLAGLVIGHDFTRKFEGDLELYNVGTFHLAENQPVLDFGGRYKLHKPVILLFMAGRSLESARSNQANFQAYFGFQVLLPPKSYPADLPENTAE